MEKIIGLDIGGTKCAAVLANVSDSIEICRKKKIPTPKGQGFEGVKPQLFGAIHALLEETGTSPSQIAAIGVSCGGPLDSRKGVILCPPNLPGWINVPITDLLWQEFKIPAYLQNDAKAGALVEWKLGAGRGTQNMMFLTMGTGMGSGIIAEGKLICGACDLAGEVGHVRIEEDGPIGFGKYGSFEGFTSGGGIARMAQAMARQALEQGKPFAFAATEPEVEALDVKRLADAARSGDETAREIFAGAGEKLGKGLACFIDTLNPEVIAIGSIFARCEELLRPSMEQVLRRECISYSLHACRVVPAQTGEAIGDLASVMVAVHGAGIPLAKDASPAIQAHLCRLMEEVPSLKPVRPNIEYAFQLIRATFLKQGKLLCCGNGGSAADCDHIVGELMKGFRLSRHLPEPMQLRPAECMTEEECTRLNRNLQQTLPAIALTQHTALTTAFANDVDAELVFAQQVYGYGRPGDALLAISTSGNSKNVVLAAKAAKALGLKVISMTGPNESELSRISDVCIRAPGDCTAQIQERHLPVYHTLCSMLEQAFFGDEES